MKKSGSVQYVSIFLKMKYAIFAAILSRDQKKICIVEEVADVAIMENTGEYKGLYHVLEAFFHQLIILALKKLGFLRFLKE